MKTSLRLRSLALPPFLIVLQVLFVGCSKDADTHSLQVADAHSSDEGEHSVEDHVELTEQQFGSAGIEVVVVASGQVTEELTLPGTVAPNADAVLHITPRVSGQVRSVSKHLGESVQAGEIMCVIDSVQLGDAIADYVRDRALLQAAEATLERETELFANRLTALANVLDGAVAIQKNIYEREEELQKKAVSTIRPLLEADKAFKVAKLERDKQLIELESTRDSRLLALEVELSTKRIDLQAAANQLRIIGLSTTDIEELDDDSPLLSGEYKVPSPGDGVVVSRHISIGEFVESSSKLYIIENLSDVWFVASAFEEQLQSVRSGQPARVSLDAFPGTTLVGAVSFLDYHVDPTSRSVGVRITLDNTQMESWPEELPLRPGMFGRAQLEVTVRQADLVIPESALVHDDKGDYVFVQVEPFAFARRDVTAKQVANGNVEITSGLETGEVVAVTGTFLLKSAERQGELGGGHGH